MPTAPMRTGDDMMPTSSMVRFFLFYLNGRGNQAWKNLALAEVLRGCKVHRYKKVGEGGVVTTEIVDERERDGR